MLFMLLFAIAGYSPIVFLRLDTLITQEMCTANGVPNLYEQVTNEYIKAFNCSIIDLVLRLTDKDDLNDYFKSKCAERSKSQICTANAISLSKKCLQPQDIKLLETWEKIDKQLLEYVCSNYLENMSAFGKKEHKCWWAVNEVLRYNCSQKMYEILDNGSYRSFNEFDCNYFEDVEMCLRNNFPKYCNEQFKDVALTTIKIIGNNLCKKTSNHLIEHKRVRRSVILRRVVRGIGLTNKIHKIEHKVKNLCITNGHTSEKLQETLDEMKNCTAEKKIFVVPKQEYLHHMEKCSNKSIELFNSCLPDKYKYLPPLLFKIMESSVSLFYDDFNVILFGLGPCVSKLNSKESTEDYDKCVDKILDNVDYELVESKEKFCQNWIPINACFINQLKKDCKSSEELTKFENDFTEAITKPCQS